jgi:ribose transport system permease protein
MSIVADKPAVQRFALSGDVMQIFYRLLAVALLCVILSALSGVFLTANNILNVLRQTALLFLMASGLTLVILTAGLDLSIGANVALSGCLAASIIKLTGSPLLGVATGIVCGTAVGFTNGILVTALRIPSFIATYGMMWMLTGITYYYMAGETIHGFPAGFRQLGSGYLLGIPMPVYFMVLFLAIGAAFAQRTIWGQQIYAIGANPVAARLSGVPVERRLVLVYAVSGAMAGLASLIILALLVGGTSLFGGSGTVAGTLIGALLLTLVLNGMNLLQINSSWQPLATGLIILIAVWIDTRTQRAGE